MPRFKYNLEERSPFEKVLAIDKGATLPSLEIQVLDGNDPVDLTAATVTFSMQDGNGVPKISGAAANLDDAATGKVSYDWAGADVDTDGNFSGQFSIVVAAGTYKIPNGSTQRLIIQIGRVTLAGLPTADGLVALHSASHILGGLDELDADQVGIDVALPNITPDTSPAEVSSTKHLGAILKGISDGIGGGGGPHGPTHESGGADEINVAGLLGLLAAAQTALAHATSHQNAGADEINVGALSGLLADAQTALAHAVSHEFGGGDVLNLAGLSGLLATAQDPIAHVVRHIVGGADPFLATQLIDAICRRLRTTTGPTDLLLGAIADGEFLKRSGTAIVGDTPAGGAGFTGWPHAADTFYGYPNLGSGTRPMNNDAIALPMILDTTKTYSDIAVRVTSGSSTLELGVYADDNGFPGAKLFLVSAAASVGLFSISIPGGFSPSSPFVWLVIHEPNTGLVFVEEAIPLARDGVNWTAGLRASDLALTLGFKQSAIGGTLPDPWTSTTQIISVVDVPAVAIKVEA